MRGFVDLGGELASIGSGTTRNNRVESEKSDVSFCVRIPSSMKAMIEKSALGRGTTQGEVVRRIISDYYSNEEELEDFEKEYANRARRKRDQTILLDSPKNVYDGMMLAARVRRLVGDIKRENKLQGVSVEVYHYKEFINMVDGNIEVAKQYDCATAVINDLKKFRVELETEMKKFAI